MSARSGTYYPRFANLYVPAMGYAADVQIGSPTMVDFGAPAVADADDILNDQSIATAVDSAMNYTIAAKYGRCLQVVASGAATSNVTVYGRDYLGQPMRESFTLNGTTPVVGVKAFKYVDRVTAAVTAATTIDLGFHDKLGIPYKAAKVVAESFADAIVGTLGTLVTPSVVDPATATTTDPRGTYDPQSTLDGSTNLKAWFIFDNTINAAGNGGLHGLKHFF